jgi:cytochrome c oxidase accessory protein FixG
LTQLSTNKKAATIGIETFDAEAVNKKENRSLYEARKKIHPKRASGKFRNFKWYIMMVALGIYYITPWIRWDRGEELPDQAVLLDMANRRFYFFIIEIWPHEFFYVAGMLVMAGIALFLVTSTLGRAWCGYTCPQTVWVDLFLVVERFIEGERNARIKLDKAPMDNSKFAKRVAKHLFWVVISVATGGAWIFYFADAPTLFVELFTGQAAYVAYATVAVLTATTYIFGGLMREQVCTYMCPWPRIQAAMLDEHSLTVTYNDWRGEQRSRSSKKLRKEGKPVGDCVDCNACVAVCPMGIDIRDGQQMECITCALCIDACDSVMEKLGLDKGLISYATLNEYDVNMQLATGNNSMLVEEIKPEYVRDKTGKLSDKITHTSWSSFVRPRSVIYSVLYLAIGAAMVFHLTMRDRLSVNVLEDRNPQFVVLSDGSIRNGYELKILNMRGEARQFLISIEGLPDPKIERTGFDTNQSKWIFADVKANKVQSLRLFVTLPRNKIVSSKMPFKFKVATMGGGETRINDVNFKAPEGIIQ